MARNVALCSSAGATHYVADLSGYFVDLSQRVAPAPAARTVPLGDVGFSDMAVDDANRRTFLSAPTVNKVLVFDFAGRPAARLADRRLHSLHQRASGKPRVAVFPWHAPSPGWTIAHGEVFMPDRRRGKDHR